MAAFAHQYSEASMTNNSETSTKVHQWTVSDYHRMLTQAFWRKTTGWSCGYIFSMSPNALLIPLPQNAPTTISNPCCRVGATCGLKPYHQVHIRARRHCCGSYRRTLQRSPSRTHEIFLLIEVADSTLGRDLGEKESTHGISRTIGWWT